MCFFWLQVDAGSDKPIIFVFGRFPQTVQRPRASDAYNGCEPFHFLRNYLSLNIHYIVEFVAGLLTILSA